MGPWTLLDPANPSYISDTISVQVNASSSGSLANVLGPLCLLGLGVAFGPVVFCAGVCAFAPRLASSPDTAQLTSF
jgi:hypothetical protein